MIRKCPVCGADIDSSEGFRQTCVCDTPLIKTQSLFKIKGVDWVWMVDADKIQMSATALWGAPYLPIKRRGENKRTINGFLYYEGNKYVVRTAPAILQSAQSPGNVKVADLTYFDIDAVLHEGWIPQSRYCDDRR